MLKRSYKFYSAVFVFIAACSGFAQGIGISPKVYIHGFVSQGYLKSTDNNFLANSKDGSFEFNEAAINFLVDVNDDLRVGLQLFSRDLGEESNNNVILDWAYGDYHWRDWLGIRIGKIKMPVGLHNVNRDVNFLRSSILLPQGVYEEMQRDFALAHQGIEIYGNYFMYKYFGDFEYELYYGTLAISNADSPYWRWALNDMGRVFFSGMGDALEYKFSGNNFSSKYVMGGALLWHTPVKGIDFKTTILRGKFNLKTHLDLNIPSLPLIQSDMNFDITIKSHDVYSCEIRLIPDLVLTAEYWRGILKANVTATGDLSLNVMEEFQGEGYYGQGVYRFNDLISIGYYYNRYFATIDDREGKTYVATGLPDYSAWQHDHAVTLRLDLTSNWILKIENHFINGANQASRFENSGTLAEDWQLFAIKSSFHF